MSDLKLSDLFRGSTIPAEAQGKMVRAAKAGKPQVVDPRGTGMTSAQLARALEAAGNGR